MRLCTVLLSCCSSKGPRLFCRLGSHRRQHHAGPYGLTAAQDKVHCLAASLPGSLDLAPCSVASISLLLFRLVSSNTI